MNINRQTCIVIRHAVIPFETRLLWMMMEMDKVYHLPVMAWYGMVVLKDVVQGTR
jgi:hypothetical protein